MAKIPKKKRGSAKRNNSRREIRSDHLGKNLSANAPGGFGPFPFWITILLITIFFSCVTLLLYSPSLNSDFVFDDKVIQKDPLIHLTELSRLCDLFTAKDMGRRVGFMSFALNFYFSRLNPFGYHLVNVIIHILNGIMLFLLSTALIPLSLDKPESSTPVFWTAFLGSVFWLVHPLQSQAVAYVVQRLTSLCTLFFLLSLFCYIQGRLHQASPRWIFFLCSLLCGLLAFDTKQNAATLPLFIILTEGFFLQHNFSVNKKRGLWMLLAGGVIFFFIAAIYLGPDFIAKMEMRYEQREWTLTERVLTQFRVVVHYLTLWVYPHPLRLNLDYDFPISHSLFSPFTTFISLLFILGMAAWALREARRNQLVSYGIFWFFGNLVIESSIIPLELVFEHRMYLPSIGLVIVGMGISTRLRDARARRTAAAVTLAIVLIFSYWTYERAKVWGSPISLWTDVAQKSPKKDRPLNNLGFAYYRSGMLDQATLMFNKALRLNPDCAEAYNNLGSIFTEQGRFDEAIESHKKALSIAPDFAEAHVNLGIAYFKKGMLDPAVTHFKKALTIQPDYIKAYDNLASTYIKKGNLDEALSECRKILAIDPTHVQTFNNLGLVYGKKGNLDESISQFRKALAIDSDFTEAHINLGIAYFKKGMIDEAISQFKKALVLDPHLLHLRVNLALAYSKQGMVSEAVTEFERAAASYAARGKFSKAAEYQQQAMELASPPLKNKLQKNLELYKLKQSHASDEQNSP